MESGRKQNNVDVVGIQWKFPSFSFSSQDFPLENHGITGKGNYLTKIKGQSTDKGVLCQGVGEWKRSALITLCKIPDSKKSLENLVAGSRT